MTCAVDDEECLGTVAVVDAGYQLCQFHERTLCVIGRDGFEEWYSIELADAKAIETRRAATGNTDAVHESAVVADDLPKGSPA